MARVYSIKNWASHYEKAQTRKVGKAQWVPLPIKHDGKGYRRLISHRRGTALFGAWVLIVQVAAKCEPRGVLVDDDGPLSADDLAAKTGAPASVFSEALEVLTGSEVGWMLVSEYHSDTNGIPLHCNTLQLQDSTEQNNTEQEKTKKRARFCPPTVEEVRGYCRERGNHVDPEAFVAFYESKGWKVGNQSMRDWKACVVTWEKRQGNENRTRDNSRPRGGGADRDELI